MKTSLFMLLLAVAPLAAVQADANYHLVRSIALDGDGSWDYLHADSPSRRLYVAHFDRVAILDMDSGQKKGEIPGLNGVHGVAVDTLSGHGFASNGRSDEVVMFDLDTLAVLGRIPAGDNPDAILYEPQSRRILAINHSGGDVSVIDPAAGKLLSTVKVGGELEYAVSDENGSVYINVEDQNELARIGPNLEVNGRWSLAPCEEPTGLAIDTRHGRLFSACGNGLLAVTDADEGQVVATVPIGQGCDGVRFDPQSRLIFTSNGEGSLTVIAQDSADSYRVVDTVATRRGARTLALDLPTHHIFSATAKFEAAPTGSASRPAIRPGSFEVLELAP